MIAGRALLHLRSPVLHVSNPHLGGCRLRHDELPKALKLGSEIQVGPIVEQNEEFEPRVISFGGNPTGDFVTIMALVDHHIALAYFGHVRAMTSFGSYHHVYRYALRTCILRTNGCDGHAHSKPE